MKTYEDYMMCGPMTDGEEIRSFFDDADTMVYLVFIHKNDTLLYGGYFSTREKAKAVCDAWNKAYENESQFADFINVTEEKDNAFILNMRW